MAAPRASIRRSRPTLLVALALLGGLLPALAVSRARAAAEPLSLQVSNEITVTASDTATLTARLSQAAAAATTIDFEVIPVAGQPSADPDNGDSPGSPDTHCDIAAQQTSCQAVLISKQVAANLVRAWIKDQSPGPDLTEGRYSGHYGLAGLSSDCTSNDGSGGGGLGGLFGSNDCESGPEAAGAQVEPDATDVVSVQWISFSQGHLNCDDA